MSGSLAGLFMERKSRMSLSFFGFLFFSLGDATPGRHGLNRPWVSASEQHLEFVGFQSLGRLTRTLGPETKATRRQAPLAKPETSGVIGKDFYGRPPAISKNEQTAGKGVGSQRFFANAGQDGGGGTAGATGSGGRTDPGISFRPAHVVEALGEDPRPAESENDPTQIHGVAVIRDTAVCLPDGLATRSQSTDDSATVPGEPATAVSGAGKCCASGHAEPAAGGDRGKRDRGSTGRTDPAVHPQEEILTLFGGELLSGGDRWNA